jgi:hypothetical protein
MADESSDVCRAVLPWRVRRRSRFFSNCPTGSASFINYCSVTSTMADDQVSPAAPAAASLQILLNRQVYLHAQKAQEAALPNCNAGTIAMHETELDKLSNQIATILQQESRRQEIELAKLAQRPAEREHEIRLAQLQQDARTAVAAAADDVVQEDWGMTFFLLASLLTKST